MLDCRIPAAVFTTCYENWTAQGKKNTEVSPEKVNDIYWILLFEVDRAGGFYTLVQSPRELYLC